jgi:hypothetical protein
MYAVDSTAMLFNLTTRQLFKSQDRYKAISYDNRCGPEFGSAELTATEPFNGNNKCWAHINGAGYKIEMDSEKISKLTNLKFKYIGVYTSNFTITELEVWEVIFSS